MTSRLIRIAAASALALGVGLGAGGTAFAQEPCPIDEHAGVCSETETQNPVDRPAAVVRPAPAPQSQSSALPVTGTDIAMTVAIGGSLIAIGTVLARRRAAAED